MYPYCSLDGRLGPQRDPLRPAWRAALLTTADRSRRQAGDVIGSIAEVISYWYVEVSWVVVRGLS